MTYYLAYGDGDRIEVTRADYIAAERACGFNAPADRCATSAFTGKAAGVKVRGWQGFVLRDDSDLRAVAVAAGVDVTP